MTNVIFAVYSLAITVAAAPTAAQTAVTGRTLLATVIDARNQPLIDLDVDEFVVREAGQSCEVLTAHLADYPLVVMLDTGAANAPDLPAQQAAVARFLNRVGDRPVAVGTFGARAHLIAGFADDRAAVLDRIAALQPEAAGPRLAIDGIGVAARAVRDLDVPFAAVVVVSGLADANSQPAASALLGDIVASRAIVHVIERQSPTPAVGGDVNLKLVADQTHGQFTPIYAADSYRVALDHLADRLAAELMIEYVAPARPPGSRPFVSEDVTVGVLRPRARIVGLGVR